MSLENRVEVPQGNRILDALPPEDYDRLLPALSPVSLELKRVLLEPGKAIETVYFPVSTIVSLMTRMDDGSAVEVATIGNEGIVGVPVFLGAQALGARDFYQAQLPGQAVAMAARSFLKATGRDPLRGMVHRYTQALFSQVTQRVACIGQHSIEERCSRWMLLTHDRVGGDEFPLTQEFLAQMLGVRRASVTVAAGSLQNAGFIRYSLGRVAIVDREGLENASCECYRIIRTEFDRLLPEGAPGYGDPMSSEFVPLDALHPELRSRVMAATAHARPRVIRRREAVAEDVPSDEYEVYALAGDRFVYMVLSLRADGSVSETTRAFLPHEIADVTIEKDEATLEVEGPSGRQSIAVPAEVARALYERRP